MSSTVQISDLMSRARKLSQMDGASGTAFITDAELEQWINDGLRWLYDLIVEARGDDYYARLVTRTSVAGTSTYALPSVTLLDSFDFYRLIGVSAHDSSNACDVPRFDIRETGRIADAYGALAPVTSSIFDLNYRLDGGQYIRFVPAPGASGWGLTIHYVPALDTKVAGESFDGINGWDDFAVLHAAIRALKKEQTLDAAQALEVEKSAIVDRITRLAGSRDEARPTHIVDSRGDWGGRYGRGFLRNDWRY